MKKVISVLLLVMVATMIGGVTGYIVSTMVMPHPPQFVAWKSGHDGRGWDAEKKIAKDAWPRKHQWIPEEKIEPCHYQPCRVVNVQKDGSVETQAIDLDTARQGLRVTLARSLRRWGKAPKEDRDAQLRWYDGEALHGEGGWIGNKKQDGPQIFPSDVFLSGIPMVDQGRAAYCAVASAARVLQGYGIEVTMEDMAVLANSSETGGTSLSRWDQAIRQVAGEHGLELKTVKEVTDTANSLSSLVAEYNACAGDMGYDRLNASDYITSIGWFSLWDFTAFSRDREYPVQREVVLSDDDRGVAFSDNVIERINDSDPLFWCVMLGDVPEEVPHSDVKVASSTREQHMRLIIGYNEDRGEILYSDSWGEGHELKRMDGQDALSITTGMYYLTDK